MRELEAGTFFGLTDLEKITLPSSLLHIERDAFTSCRNLKQINIPEGILAIDPYAFNGCRALQKLALPGNIPGLGARAFYGCDDLTIQAPDGSETLHFAMKEGIKTEALPAETAGTNSLRQVSPDLDKGPSKMDEFQYVRGSLAKILRNFFG